MLLVMTSMYKVGSHILDYSMIYWHFTSVFNIRVRKSLMTDPTPYPCISKNRSPIQQNRIRNTKTCHIYIHESIVYVNATRPCDNASFPRRQRDDSVFSPPATVHRSYCIWFFIILVILLINKPLQSFSATQEFVPKYQRRNVTIYPYRW